MSDEAILFSCAVALVAVLAIPVPRSVRTALLLLTIGFAVCWILTSGLVATVGWFN